MKATIPWLGSALVAVVVVSAADAQVPGGCRVRRAPDACGPGYYAPNINGLWYGPNYDVRPPCCPFNGVLFHPSPKEKTAEQTGPNGPAGPYAYNNPTRPGTLAKPGNLEPGPYRGPTGGEALQGPNPAGPNNPYAIYGPGGLYDRYIAGPGGAYALNVPPAPPAPYGPPAPPAPYGPYAYYAPPPYAPPCPEGQCLPTAPPPAVFPTHPYARSPRDFFMIDD